MGRGTRGEMEIARWRSFEVRIFRESNFFLDKRRCSESNFYRKIEKLWRGKSFLKLVLAFVLKIVFW